MDCAIDNAHAATQKMTAKATTTPVYAALEPDGRLPSEQIKMMKSKAM